MRARQGRSTSSREAACSLRSPWVGREGLQEGSCKAPEMPPASTEPPASQSRLPFSTGQQAHGRATCLKIDAANQLIVISPLLKRKEAASGSQGSFVPEGCWEKQHRLSCIASASAHRRPEPSGQESIQEDHSNLFWPTPAQRPRIHGNVRCATEADS